MEVGVCSLRTSIPASLLLELAPPPLSAPLAAQTLPIEVELLHLTLSPFERLRAQRQVAGLTAEMGLD